MLKTKTTLIALLSAAMLAACGGGGGDSSEGDSSPFRLLSAETRNDGSMVNLSFAGGLISQTLAAPSALTVTANGVSNPVASVIANGTTVDLVLTRRILSGQTVIVTYAAPAYDPLPTNAAIQNTDGVDAAAFSDLSVANTVAARPTVLLNGATATIGSNGEYSVSAPTRVTVDDARVGSSSSRTVDASGASTSASMSIHTITASKYDVTFTSAPVGGLTTINLGGTAESPLLVIKLRWQNSESVNETPEVVATDARTKNVDGEGFPNALDLDSYVTKVSN